MTEPLETTVDDDYAGGTRVPWRAKMAIKIFLSRLPVSYQGWGNLGIFRHGELGSNPGGLHKQFSRFMDAYRDIYDTGPEHILELGPGDSVANSIYAACLGIKSYTFVDAGDFASNDPEHYRNYEGYLKEKNLRPGCVLGEYDRESVLQSTGAAYLTKGIESLRSMPKAVLDYSFSQAVLEHVRRDEFADTMRELFRMHKPGSFSMHWVDLHDHLGGGLNHLRFSPSFWERPLIWNSGFYTNRLMMHEMKAMAEAAGFKASIVRVHRWGDPAEKTRCLAKEFRHFSPAELNVCTFLMHLRAPGTGSEREIKLRQQGGISG